MKEIIYLNTKLVNSMLAQLNTGLITKLINEQGITDTKGESTNETVSSTLNYKGNVAVFSGGVTSADTFTDATNVVFSKNTPNYNNLKKQLADSHWYNFKLFNDISTYVNNLFKENTLIKINEFVSICENQYLRLSTPQLYFNNFSDKNITVLAFIITKINEKVPNEFSDSLSELNDFFKNGPALISNIMLGSTNVIDENDFIVRPIAIYYDLK